MRASQQGRQRGRLPPASDRLAIVRIVVTGPPGSGKSTLSHALADELGLVLLVKDDLKQQLLARHPAGGVAESRRRGREAVRLLLDRARSVEAAVLDSVWVDRDGSRRELQALGGVVEVFCRCDVETMRRRYAARAGTRPAGWFDLDREDDERWPPEALEPLAGGWPVVEVDTTGPVDVTAVVHELRCR